jgi:hypothetical protein
MVVPMLTGGDEAGREIAVLRRLVAAAATQARHDLVKGLLSGKGSDADGVRRWAAYLGYDEQRQRRVLSFVAGGHNSDDLTRRVLAAVERFFATQVPDAITALRGHEVVVVLPEPDPASPRSSRIDRAPLELNLSKPDLVSTTHESYVGAGVDLIFTLPADFH